MNELTEWIIHIQAWTWLISLMLVIAGIGEDILPLVIYSMIGWIPIAVQIIAIIRSKEANKT